MREGQMWHAVAWVCCSQKHVGNLHPSGSVLRGEVEINGMHLDQECSTPTVEGKIWGQWIRCLLWHPLLPRNDTARGTLPVLRARRGSPSFLRNKSLFFINKWVWVFCRSCTDPWKRRSTCASLSKEHINTPDIFSRTHSAKTTPVSLLFKMAWQNGNEAS